MRLIVFALALFSSTVYATIPTSSPVLIYIDIADINNPLYILPEQKIKKCYARAGVAYSISSVKYRIAPSEASRSFFIDAFKRKDVSESTYNELLVLHDIIIDAYNQPLLSTPIYYAEHIFYRCISLINHKYY